LEPKRTANTASPNHDLDSTEDDASDFDFDN
jgi:hypothetical protein